MCLRVMSVQMTLFGYKLKKEDHIYKDPRNKYEQFAERFYQRNRTAAAGKSRQELVKEAQVYAPTPYINMPTSEATWFLTVIIELYFVLY